MIRRERRDGGEGEERGLKKGLQREDRDQIERKETKGNSVNNLKRRVNEHRHLPMLV